MPIRVLLADDHVVVRDGLRLILEADGDMTVVGDAANGQDALRKARELHPDVVLMDIAMPDLNGIEATQRIREQYPSVQVVILSMHATTEHIHRALQAGARGYLLKESAGKEVATAIRAVHAGRRYMSEQIAETALNDYARRRKAPNDRSPIEQLSPREREVLQLVVEGKSSTDIATLVHLSPKTIDTYRGRIMEKLGVHDLPALVRL